MNRIQMAGTAIAMGGIIGGAISGGLTASESGPKNGIQFREIAPTAGISVAAATLGTAFLLTKDVRNHTPGAVFLGVAAGLSAAGLAWSALNTHSFGP